MSRKRLGYSAIAAAALLWAAGGTFARSLIDRGASPVELTAARAWIAVAGVGSIIAIRRRAPVSLLSWLTPRNGAALIAFGLALAAANFTYYAAIERLPVAVAVVTQYTAPGMVVAWKAVAARRAPSARVGASLMLVLAGVTLLSEVYRFATGGGSALDPSGVGIALGSAVAFAAYILLGEAVGSALGSLGSVFYAFVVAGIFWAIVLALRGRPDTLLADEFYPGIAFLGVAATIAPFLLFVWGLGIVRASPAGIVSTLEPVGGAVFAYVWLGQSLSTLQIVGAAAVIAGIAVIQAERQPVSP